MKQTNSAIKFLMAQYRAIFKNANLKMFLAATAAAVALSSGAAHAVPGENTDPKPSFTNELKDSVLSKDETITVNDNTFVVLDAPAGKPITIDGGKLVLTKQAESRIFTGHDLVLNSGSIDISGKGTPDAIDTGLVGATKDDESIGGASYVYSLDVNGGTVNLKNAFIQMKEVSLNGGKTTIEGKQGRQNQGSNVNGLMDYSTIYASEGTFHIGNNAVVDMNPASGIYGDKVEITGGTVNFNGTTDTGTAEANSGGSYIRAGNGSFDTSITMTGGKLNVATDKFGNVHATEINIAGGQVNVAKAGTMTIGTNFASTANTAMINVTGGEVNVAAGGKLVLTGNAAFADGTLKNLGTIDMGTLKDGQSRVLTLGSNDFNNNFLKGAEAKLTVAGTTNNPGEELNLVVKGNADLIGSGFLAAETGAESSKLTLNATDVKTTLIADSATLDADKYAGKVELDVGSLTAGKAGVFSIKSGSSITVDHALNVTPKDGKATLNVGGNLYLDGRGGNVNADITLAQDTAGTPKLFVGEGTWGIKDLTLTSGAATVSGDKSVLNIGGMLKTTATNGTLTIADSATVDASAGDLNLAAETVSVTDGSTLILDSADVFTFSSGTATLVTAKDDVKSTFAKNAVTTDATSVLKIKYNGQVKVEDISTIRTALADANKLNGFFNLQGVTITDAPTEDIALSDAKFAEGIDGLYNKVAVIAGTNGAVDKSFTAGQVKLAGTDTTAAIAADKTVMLNGSKDNFVVKSDGKTAADASLASGSSLVLAGNGSIGAISSAATDASHTSTVMIGHSSLGTGTVKAKSIGGGTGGLDVYINNSTLDVEGAVTALELDLSKGSTLKTKGNIKANALTLNTGARINTAGTITANNLDVMQGASIDAGDKAIALGNGTNNINSSILGDVKAGALTFNAQAGQSHELLVAGGAKVDLESIKGANGLTIQVGVDSDPSQDEKSSTASVFVNKLDLNSGDLFVDPDYDQPVAKVYAASLSGGTANNAGSLTGNATVGKNAILAIGFDKKDSAVVDTLIAPYIDAADGSLDENKLSNALILNKSITVSGGKGITLSNSATIANKGIEANKLKLNANTALIITENAFTKNADGTKTGPAIKLNDAGAEVIGNGGEIILAGDFDKADTLMLFENNTAGTKATIKGEVRVLGAGGTLGGVVDTATGKVSLAIVEAEMLKQYGHLSTPVYQLIYDKNDAKFKTSKGLGKDFINDALSAKNGDLIDKAAHAATCAGAQQAAVAAVGTMAEAIGGRVGAIGVEAASIQAAGTQANGGVWISPMYKSVESDGFAAQGASYGADVDLAGVAFGADTVNGNMRFGAVFNIGSGDSDGKGMGAGVKDEFDYYGFGIYSAMSFDQFALVGDASLNVISHDVKANTGLPKWGELSGSADTTAITVGLTGQYAIATPMVDVVPHAGMRFTRLDTDSYDLNTAKGVIGSTDFEVQNVFSIPLGVSLSKAFEMGGWSFAPSADFTLTFNTGDTEVESSTYFIGTRNMNMNTEVLDEVTYGINLGIGAQFGSFGAAFSLNYTGSENTDAFGVNANARYMF